MDRTNEIKFQLSKLSPQPHDIILLRMKSSRSGNLFNDMANMMDYAGKLVEALDANGLKNQVVLLPEEIQLCCKEQCQKWIEDLEQVISAIREVEKQAPSFQERRKESAESGYRTVIDL